MEYEVLDAKVVLGDGPWVLLKASGPEALALVGKLVAITDELGGDATLDRATEECAEAWGVNYYDIVVLKKSDLEEGYSYCARIVASILPFGRLDDYSFARGDTRVAAVKALTVKAKPKLPDIDDMTICNVQDEIEERIRRGERIEHTKTVSGHWNTQVLTASGEIVAQAGSETLPVLNLIPILRALRERDGV